MFYDGQEVTANIYCLKHNDNIIYIGCTTNGIDKRLYNHYACSKRNSNVHIHRFMRIHSDVSISLIEEVKYKYDKRIGHIVALKLEAYWIKKYRMNGNNLMNEKILGEPLLKRPGHKEKKAPTPFRHNLKLARSICCLSMSEAAYKIGIGKSLLWAYESGRCKPKTETIYKIMSVYNIPNIQDFINDKMELAPARKEYNLQ